MRRLPFFQCPNRRQMKAVRAYETATDEVYVCVLCPHVWNISKQKPETLPPTKRDEAIAKAFDSCGNNASRPRDRVH